MEKLKNLGWSLLFFGIIIVALCAEGVIDKLC